MCDQSKAADRPGTAIGVDGFRLLEAADPLLPSPGTCSLASRDCLAAEKVLVPVLVCKPRSAGCDGAVPLLLLACVDGGGCSHGLLTRLGRSDAAVTLPASACAAAGFEVQACWACVALPLRHVCQVEYGMFVQAARQHRASKHAVATSHVQINKEQQHLHRGVFGGVKILVPARRSGNARALQPAA